MAVLTAMLLLVPLVLMQFTVEVQWAPGDFVAAGLLLFGGGIVYVLATRRSDMTRRNVFVGTLMVTALAVSWAELALGLFD